MIYEPLRLENYNLDILFRLDTLINGLNGGTSTVFVPETSNVVINQRYSNMFIKYNLDTDMVLQLADSLFSMFGVIHITILNDRSDGQDLTVPIPNNGGNIIYQNGDTMLIPYGKYAELSLNTVEIIDSITYTTLSLYHIGD